MDYNEVSAETPHIQAIGDRIIVRPIKDEVRASGLYVTDDQTNPIQKGEVVSIGESVDFSGVTAGEIVYFKRPGAWEVEIAGEDLLWVHEDYVLAKLR